LPNTEINFDILDQHPLMIVISGPSGVGKDSVLRALKKSPLPIYHVITANTRSPRPDEKEGVDYFFVSHEEFEGMIENNELIEYAHVYGDYKGVPKSQIRKALDSGKDVVLRLDVQGAEKIKKMYPDAILIFLTPSNQEEWYQRLGGRTHSQEKDMDQRIATVIKELENAKEFDYIVVNPQGKLNSAIATIEAIITAEHHRAKQRKIEI
jgi:guanylate kinase